MFPSLSGTAAVVATTTNSAGSTVLVAQTGSATTTIGGNAASQTSAAPSNTGNAAPGLKVEMCMAATLFLGALGVLGLA